jgi:hypothetical protein
MVSFSGTMSTSSTVAFFVLLLKSAAATALTKICFHLILCLQITDGKTWYVWTKALGHGMAF